MDETEVSPIEFRWLISGRMETAAVPPSIENAPSVVLPKDHPETLTLYLHETPAPSNTLVRQCERIGNDGFPDTTSCIHEEYGAGYTSNWVDHPAGLQLDVALQAGVQFVTVTIQYPNENGWDESMYEDTENHANYAFFLGTD
ncbi:hypothetical protein DDD63_08705 [Actinobaculum sp. 313]|nr:hypothetical protein DDD63_08705 [Actinobaculum sp. 313]